MLAAGNNRYRLASTKRVADARRVPVERGKAATLPPRWFIRTAWVVHRAIYRFTGDGAIAMAAQIQGSDELAVNYDWASNGEHLINVGLAALLVGMQKPGVRALAFMAGAVVAFMGAAAITAPMNPGSWGTLGGAAGIAAGIILIAITASDSRGEQLLRPS